MTDSLKSPNALGKDGGLPVVSSLERLRYPDFRTSLDTTNRHGANGDRANGDTTFVGPQGGCLLKNGGFEAGFANWVTLEGTEQISKQSYIGMAALVLSTVDSGTTQNVGVTPGQIFQLMGYGCSIDTEYSSFGMTFFDGQGRFLARSDVGKINTYKWHDYYAVEMAPSRAAYVQVWTYQSSNHGLTYIDGLSLRAINPNDLPTRPFNRFRLSHAPLAPGNSLFSDRSGPVVNDERCRIGRPLIVNSD